MAVKNQSRLAGDYFIDGQLSSKTLLVPAGSVDDEAVAPGAGVDPTKLGHQHQPAYSQPTASAAAAEQKVVHLVRGATGVVESFTCGACVANIGAAVVHFDLLKNGATILTATVDLTSAQAAYTGTLQPGAYTATSLVAGDVLEVKVTVAAGGGTLAKGVFASLVVREDAQ